MKKEELQTTIARQVREKLKLASDAVLQQARAIAEAQGRHRAVQWIDDELARRKGLQ